MTAEPADNLTPQQSEAVIALMNHAGINTAAEAVGISERTLRRWMKEPGFAAVYREARRETFSHAIALTLRFSAHMVNTLTKIATDQSAPHAARVSAARPR